MATDNKPLILICVTPFYGHLMPIRAIGKGKLLNLYLISKTIRQILCCMSKLTTLELITRGYEVTFVTGSAYRETIEEIGASFVPLSGYADFTEVDIPTRWPLREPFPKGPL